VTHDRRPGDTLGPEAETPAVRRRSSERNEIVSPREFEARPESSGARRERSMTTIGAMVVSALLHVGTWAGGAQGYSVLRYQVDQHQAWQEKHTDEVSKRREEMEGRVRSLEQARAGAERDMAAITGRLDTIDRTLERIEAVLTGDQPRRRQPRTRPIGAPPRVPASQP
jgi:hypothetical protein